MKDFSIFMTSFDRFLNFMIFMIRGRPAWYAFKFLLFINNILVEKKVHFIIIIIIMCIKVLFEKFSVFKKCVHSSPTIWIIFKKMVNLFEFFEEHFVQYVVFISIKV
jgi:hypothetical protein